MIKINMDSIPAKIELGNLFSNPDSILKCDKCYCHLGFCHTLKSALFKKQNQIYLVRCKKCGYLNSRKKGEYRKNQKDRYPKKSLKKN